MSSIFHTDRKWVAGLCYVGFLVLTLMVASFVFFPGDEPVGR